ncbi:phage minor head protein [uncultured Ilyobacter sp.]|uniref:phage head morphogenesis protein n=1 Tax=uncultured Ilyobacter sp. TaxID=544433 RepID=UPI0029C02B13|nr:phage minor head protein [uncultured Ilyobacter sp.]
MFNFFKRKKSIEFSKEPLKNKALLREIALSNLGIVSIYPDTPTLVPEKINKMLHSLEISTPVLSMVRGVCSRRIELRSKGEHTLEEIKEISNRFDSIENWHSFIRELALTPYYGFAVFEKVYNENFTLRKLEFIPRSKVRYEHNTGKWFLRGNSDIELTEDKFIIAKYDESLEYPLGKSLFTYGLAQAHDDYINLEAKVRGIQKKYGDIIPVFGFDEMEAETEEGRKQVKIRAESVKNMMGGNVMAIPLGGNFSLKDSFFFISLSDLKIEMHKILLERLEKKIDKFIKGAAFSEGDTGSYSRDSVQQDEKEKIEDDIAVFMAEELLKLIRTDSFFFGYDPSGLHWTFDIDEGEEAREELEKKKVETGAVKIDSYNKAKELGYKISKNKVAELLGVEENDLEEVADAQPAFEFSKSKKKIDFYLEKTLENVKLLDEGIATTREEFTKGVFEQALKQLKKVKSIKDLKEAFSYDLSWLQDKLIIAALIGAMDEKEMDMSEFSEEINPFNLPYDEAISTMLERVPTMYNLIEPITEEIRSRYTWIKKSTELETTKKLIGNLQNSLESGKTFKEWIKNSDEILKNTGFGENGWYLNLVWRNNIHSAYNAGAYIQQEENKENKPYGLYDAIEDGRESDICKTLNGRVYPLDHAFWDTYMPPNHHNCRSKRIAVSKEDLKEYGLKSSSKITSDIEGFKSKIGDFVGNPTKVWKNLEKGTKIKEKTIIALENEVDDLINETLKKYKVDFEISKFKPKLERELSTDILKRFGIEGVPVKHKSMRDYGYVSWRRSTGNMTEMVFKTGDKRSIESKIKTMFHELFHASKLNWNALEMPLALEETMAESVGTFLAEYHGANQKLIANSYMDYLTDALPKLKTLEEFKDCKYVSDFGSKLLELGREKVLEVTKKAGIEIKKVTLSTDYRKKIAAYSEALTENKEAYRETFVELTKDVFDLSKENERKLSNTYYDEIVEKALASSYEKTRGENYLYPKLLDTLWKFEGVK